MEIYDLILIIFVLFAFGMRFILFPYWGIKIAEKININKYLGGCIAFILGIWGLLLLLILQHVKENKE